MPHRGAELNGKAWDNFQFLKNAYRDANTSDTIRRGVNEAAGMIDKDKAIDILTDRLESRTKEREALNKEIERIKDKIKAVKEHGS
jgi:chaperonin cofactor prefoldin